MDLGPSRFCFLFVLIIIRAMIRQIPTLIILPLLTLLLSCSNSAQTQQNTLTIFAAASLTEAFEAMTTEFKQGQSEVNVVLNFAGSQALRVQLEQGAKADIFASADTEHMEQLVAAKLVNEPEIFSQNHLTLIAPENNPASIETLADLTQPDLKLILAGPNVPVGRYSREILNNLDGQLSLSPDFSDQVLNNLVSEEDNVKGVLAKIRLGEADAGFVYDSDVIAIDNVIKIDIPSEFNVSAQYPIAILSQSPNPDLAQSFIDFALSDTGQMILQAHGFDGVINQ